MLVSLYFLLTMVVFSMGLAALFATCQVYFRDTSSFLPYFLRLWMYLSPVLWMPEMLSRMSRRPAVLVELNPMYPMLTGYAHLLQDEAYPPAVDVDRRRAPGRSVRSSSVSCSSSRGSVSSLSASPDERQTGLAVKVDNLSITYRTTFERKPTLRQALVRFGRGSARSARCTPSRTSPSRCRKAPRWASSAPTAPASPP